MNELNKWINLKYKVLISIVHSYQKIIIRHSRKWLKKTFLSVLWKNWSSKT